MDDPPILKRVYYNYLGYLYWFTHLTSKHRVLGLRVSTIIKFLAVALFLAAWLYDWGNAALIVFSLLMIWLFIGYWSADRAGYFRFVAAQPTPVEQQNYEKLQPYKRVSCIASGIFSVHDWEKNVLLCPANYWQVPRGEHALMVEHEPHKYLYQFFDVATMQELQRGWLLHGAHPWPALSIRYFSIWGPEFSQIQYSIFGSEIKAGESKLRTIYLSFPSDEAEEIICSNILSDVERYREQLSNPAD